MHYIEQFTLYIRRLLRPIKKIPDYKRVVRSFYVAFAYFVLLLILGFVFGRMQDPSNTNMSNGYGTSADSPSYHNPIDDTNIRNSIIEFGEPDKIINNEKPLLTYIRFPKAGGFTDAIIQTWAQNLYQDKLALVQEKAALDATIEGELNIHFDSFLIGERFVGVTEIGIFNTTDMANPMPILQTFNFDLANESQLSNEEILDFSQLDSILALVTSKIEETFPDASIDPPDRSWLQHITIGHDGIIVNLPRATALASAYGEISIVLDYSSVNSYLLIADDIAQAIATTSPPTTDVLEPVAVQGERRAVDPNRPMVALTFDDGPNRNTTELLHLLSKHEAYATFCVIGNLIESRSNIIRDAFERGNEIIGHSWDHLDLTSLSDDAVRNEILQPRNALLNIISDSPLMYRPPFGSKNDHVRQLSAELGFSLLLWNVDSEDWSSMNADKIYEMVMSNVKDGDIILSHDIYSTTIEAYARIIPSLIEKGFQLVTVSELLQYSNVTPQPGQLIFSAGQVN